MTTLPKATRERLAERYTAARPEVTSEQRSADGTRKWLLRFPDGQEVESVFISLDRGAAKDVLEKLEKIFERTPPAGARSRTGRSR